MELNTDFDRWRDKWVNPIIVDQMICRMWTVAHEKEIAKQVDRYKKGLNSVNVNSLKVK